MTLETRTRPYAWCIVAPRALRRALFHSTRVGLRVLDEERDVLRFTVTVAAGAVGAVGAVCAVVVVLDEVLDEVFDATIGDDAGNAAGATIGASAGANVSYIGYSAEDGTVTVTPLFVTLWVFSFTG